MCLVEGTSCKYWSGLAGDQNQGKRSGNNARQSSFPLQDKVFYWKKLFSFGIQVLYSKRMTFILYAHKHTVAAQGLGFFIV